MIYSLVKLEKIAEFINGVAFKEEDWHEDGKKIIRIQNLNDSSKPYNLTRREVFDKNIAKNGDLLISWAASLGVYRWSGEDSCINQHIFKVIPDVSRVDLNYLQHALTASLREMEKQMHGATMKHITRGRFLDIQIPLPPLPEQRRIAAILDKAEALRTTRREAIAKLDQLLQSVFLEMFGNSKNDLTVQKIGEITDVQGGIQLSAARQKIESKYPYLRVANVYRGKLELSEIKLLGVNISEYNRTKLQKNDLLIVEGHGNPKEIGRCALWDGSIDDCIHQNHLIRCRIKNNLVTPEYLEYYLNSQHGRLHLSGAANTTSGLNTISVSKVRDVPVPIPEIGVQKKWGEFKKRIDQYSHKNSLQLLKLNELLNSLRSAYFKS